MGKVLYTVKQGFQQMLRNRGMTLASMFAITAMLLILGVFFVILLNVNIAAESIENDYDTIEVYLLDSIHFLYSPIRFPGFTKSVTLLIVTLYLLNCSSLGALRSPRAPLPPSL